MLAQRIAGVPMREFGSAQMRDLQGCGVMAGHTRQRRFRLFALCGRLDGSDAFETAIAALDRARLHHLLRETQVKIFLNEDEIDLDDLADHAEIEARSFAIVHPGLCWSA